MYKNYEYSNKISIILPSLIETYQELLFFDQSGTPSIHSLLLLFLYYLSRSIILVDLI